MIRDINKVYAEANDPNTVTTSGTLAEKSIAIGAGDKTVTAFDYNSPNKYLGTDANGNLILTKSNYDLVITTQAQFDAMIASPTWLDAKRVAIVAGGGTSPSYSWLPVPAGAYAISDRITIPNTVELIEGLSSGTSHATSRATLLMLYSASQTIVTEKIGALHGSPNNNTKIKNLHVQCSIEDPVNSTIYSVAVSNIGSIEDCWIVASAGKTGSQVAQLFVSGLFECQHIINTQIQACQTLIRSNSTDVVKGFDTCNYLVNSYCREAYAPNGGQGYGYYNCKYGSNCGCSSVGTGLGTVTTATNSGCTKWSSDTCD